MTWTRASPGRAMLMMLLLTAAKRPFLTPAVPPRVLPSRVLPPGMVVRCAFLLLLSTFGI
jgi:hypothetical protein